MISEPFPPHLTYELMTDKFLAMTEESYPSPDRILHIIEEMDIKSVKGKIIVLSMMRDTVKQVSPKHLYRSIEHRDDLYTAIIEALEELEDELEELEESMEEENEEENDNTEESKED